MSGALRARFAQRGGGLLARQPVVEWTVTSMGWAAVGGPTQARLTASGNEMELAELARMLGCGVEIVDELERPVWWGLLNSATIAPAGAAYGVGLTLDGMANRINVVYSYVEAGTNNVGERKSTGWAQDDDSVAMYGNKELVVSISGATDEQALAVRAQALAQRAWPITELRAMGAKAGGGADITCVGWWDTLDWVVWKNAGTATVDQAGKIETVLAEAGQFLEAVSNEVGTTGVTVGEGQTEDRTALTTLRELIKGSGGTRLLPRIGADRVARLATEPALGATPHVLQPDGRITTTYGVELDAPPVGQWVEARYLMGFVGGGATFFLEEADWSPRGLRLRSRDVPAPYDLMGLRS